MSGPPMYGDPMSGPSYGAPAGKKGRAVLVLAVVAGLLFVLGGVMTGLFLNASGDLNRAETQLSERDATIAANAKDMEKLKFNLQRAQATLAETQQDLTGTKNDRDEQARQKKVIATCLDKLTTALGAAAAGNRSAYDKARKGLDKVCEEAEDYL
ncbi:hypothetical protein [Micromonospora sp. NPDC126480]|uniref:hypothetical protein n=1 Tax=Micromonospora sp. NPDC126480 TaxID=3155312 RepID=UPI0033300E95